MTTRAAVTINTQADRDQVARWAQNVSLGTIVEFRKKTRSHEQNAKLHAMLAEVADQVDWYGSKLEPEDWKTMFTASLRKANVIPGIDAGTVVPLGLSTSAMTVDEMSNLIELIYAFGSDPAHPIAFKEPQEDNSNSAAADQSPSGQSPDSDETGPVSSQHDGGEVDSPSASPPSAPSIDDGLRGKLIAFTKATVGTLKDDALDGDAKRRVIEGSEIDWRDAIAKPNWPKMATVKLSAFAVIDGKRTVEQMVKYIAGELLECPVSEIGG